ncbi:MAG: hypothetical protein ACTH3N_04010 [Corynebacterium casei]
MTESLLLSLRNSALDEGEPLAGLLRKCLMLGAETGSDSLRRWARSELFGYENDADVPEYRKLRNVPVELVVTNGVTIASGQRMSWFQLPEEVKDFLSPDVHFVQSVEALEQLAKDDSVVIVHPGLDLAKSIMNRDSNDPFVQIMNMSYKMSSAEVAGIVGRVRSTLVDIVADLTSHTPLETLPKKEQVDAAITERFGNTYNTTINGSTGPVAVGDHSSANQGLGIEEVRQLLQDLLKVAASEGVDSTELAEAVDEVDQAIVENGPGSSVVRRKTKKLREVAEKIGTSGATAAVTAIVNALLPPLLG